MAAHGRLMLRAMSGRYFKGLMVHSPVAGWGVMPKWSKVLLHLTATECYCSSGLVFLFLNTGTSGPLIRPRPLVLCRSSMLSFYGSGQVFLHSISMYILMRSIHLLQLLHCWRLKNICTLVRQRCNSDPPSILQLALQWWSYHDLLEMPAPTTQQQQQHQDDNNDIVGRCWSSLQNPYRPTVGHVRRWRGCRSTNIAPAIACHRT